MVLIKFDKLNVEKIKTVCEFLDCIQNGIRFDIFTKEERLLSKIADLIVSYGIPEFDDFWSHFKSLSGPDRWHGDIDQAKKSLLKTLLRITSSC